MDSGYPGAAPSARPGGLFPGGRGPAAVSGRPPLRHLAFARDSP